MRIDEVMCVFSQSLARNFRLLIIGRDAKRVVVVQGACSEVKRNMNRPITDVLFFIS